MAKLWAGRFGKETDLEVNDFNSSISFDCRLYKEDITGSMAHAAMLLSLIHIYVFFQYPLLSIVSPDFNRIFLAVWLAGCVLSCIFSYKDVRAMRRYMACLLYTSRCV